VSKFARQAFPLLIGAFLVVVFVMIGSLFYTSAQDDSVPAIQIVPADSPSNAPAADIASPNSGDINSIFDPDPWVWWRTKARLADYRVIIDWDRDHDFTLNTDAQGFRDTDATSDAAQRVVVVGDSTAFGVGVDDDDTWPAQLQRMLREDATIINAGVPGYSTFQALRMAEKYALEPKPDVLVVCAGFNDSGPSNTELPDLARAEKNERDSSGERSGFFALLEDAAEGARKITADPMRPRLTAEELASTLAQAEDFFADQGIKLLWVQWPEAAVAHNNTEPAAGYPDVLAEHCERDGVTCVDLLPVFREAEESPYYDFVHATALGNALAAEAIMSAL